MAIAPKLRTPLLLAGLAFGSLGCSTNTGGSNDDEDAALTIAITDAASDELSSFRVELSSIRLRRAAGSSVGVLAEAVEVDLTTLTEASQVLNISSVPPGLYTEAEVEFDFSSAEAYLVGESDPATILDSDGAALTGSASFPVEIGDVLRAIAGRHRILELDFDLDQSVTVDADANEVRMEPTFVMRVDRSDPKELFLPGRLVRVLESQNEFRFTLTNLAGDELSTVDATTTELTVFQIDGVPFIGADGLNELDALPVDTWVQVYGAIDASNQSIDATYVEAGSGTYGGGDDIVEGHVLARTGGAGSDATLMVLGHSNDATHTNFLFNTTFTVQASFADTAVLRRGASTSGDTDDLNVGQRVRLFGTLSGTTLDLADGVARMQPTRVTGFAADAPGGGELTLGLERVDLRGEDEFTWTDGGTTPPDPEAFVATVDSLGQGLGIETDSIVALRGFFAAIDDDGTDFTAISLENRDQAPSLLTIHDRSGGFTLTPTVDEDGIELALEGTAGLLEVARVDSGLAGSIDLPTDPVPSIVPAAGFTLFSIRDRDTGEISLHLEYTDFATTLDEALAGSAVIFNLTAIGVYSSSSNRMTAGLIAVVLD